MSEFDRAWFKSKLDAAGRSQADLARHLGLPPPSITRLFDGKRKLKLEEAETVARFLNVATEEVLAHAGVKLSAEANMDLSLRSIIDGSGAVKPAAAPLAVSVETMNLLKANIPFDRRNAYEVAQVRAAKGEMSLLDDNLVLYETPVTMNPGPASVLSVSKLRDGSILLGKVTEWRKTGEAKIKTPDGQTRQVEMAASSPVKLIVP